MMRLIRWMGGLPWKARVRGLVGGGEMRSLLTSYLFHTNIHDASLCRDKVIQLAKASEVMNAHE